MYAKGQSPPVQGKRLDQRSAEAKVRLVLLKVFRVLPYSMIYLFKIVVRSERLCILVTGLLDAFVTASNLRRIKSDHRPLSGVRPCIPEDVLGFQLGSNSDLKPSGYPIQKKLSMLPTCRVTTSLTVMKSRGWRLFTDGGFKRNPDCTGAAGSGIAAVSLDNLVQIASGPLVCGAQHPAFFGATSCCNNTAELTGFAEAIRWINFLTRLVNVCVILHETKDAARVAFGFAHDRRYISLAGKCNDLVLRSKERMRRHCGLFWYEWIRLSVQCSCILPWLNVCTKPSLACCWRSFEPLLDVFFGCVPFSHLYCAHSFSIFSPMARPCNPRAVLL